VALFDVESRAESARYFLPLALAFEGREEPSWAKLQAAAVARVRQQARTGVLSDAFADERFCRAVVEEIGSGTELRMAHGRLRFLPTSAYRELRGDVAAEITTADPVAQGSNTAVRVGDRLFLKALRRVQPGINPELELGRFLTEVAHFANVVPLAGAVEYVASDGTPATLMLLQAFVRNQGDGWDYTLNYLARFLEDSRAAGPPPPDAHVGYLALVHTLGQRTAELHCALATPTEDAALAAQPVMPEDLTRWNERVRAEAEETLELLSRPEDLPAALRTDALLFLSRRAALLRMLRPTVASSRYGLKLRHHGDYHLGQVLLRRNDFIIVDFEGEPARSLEARREKNSPLRDVAGMLRSFTYARHSALRRGGATSAEDTQKWEPLLAQWERDTRETFLSAYDATARAGGLYESLEDVRPLLRFYETEKALYELRYELRNRPDWVDIPLGSLLSLIRAD
jgi:maltose alpha-D-glucosyltransferase/alpha-amylase